MNPIFWRCRLHVNPSSPPLYALGYLRTQSKTYLYNAPSTFVHFFEEFTNFLSIAATTPHEFLITGTLALYVDNPSDSFASEFLTLLSSYKPGPTPQLPHPLSQPHTWPHHRVISLIYHQICLPIITPFSHAFNIVLYCIWTFIKRL